MLVVGRTRAPEAMVPVTVAAPPAMTWETKVPAARPVPVMACPTATLVMELRASEVVPIGAGATPVLVWVTGVPRAVIGLNCAVVPR